MKLKKYIYVLPLAFASMVQAQSVDTRSSGFSGFSTQDLKITIENIVRLILGFLGILVIVAIMYGGFKMMISRGNADDVADGRKIITAGFIGLVIVFAAYAIATFVINSLIEAV